MARKKIQKAPKTPRVEEEEEDEQQMDSGASVEASPPKGSKNKKGGKGPKNPSGNLNLFSDAFNSKVEHFSQFYKDFLVVRADGAEALSQVTERVAGKLEGACTEVLKEDLHDAEKWISEQQDSIREQINSTERAVESTRAALETAGTFSSSEIEQQVAGIIAKGKALGKKLQDFSDLKGKATEIYKEDSENMDQE